MRTTCSQIIRTGGREERQLPWACAEFVAYNHRAPNMSLRAGSMLGPYQVTALIGAGGMGEVFRARDTRLNRDVAIKTSKAGFDGRFQREAQAIAALNHPNICTLFDVGPDYLVMEYVDGPTLAERIRRGPIPLDEAIAIARQIAAALEAAHERNIVHRDLKPANIKLRPDGAVKVLDFGLAKALVADASNTSLSMSPTITSPGCTCGAWYDILGRNVPKSVRRPVRRVGWCLRRALI